MNSMVEMDFKKQLRSMKRTLDFTVNKICDLFDCEIFRSAILESLIKKTENETVVANFVVPSC